jgi:coproporphyrinogen III oxidase-like Fe-S oxidoreductase
MGGRRSGQDWEARLSSELRSAVNLTPEQLSAFSPEIKEAMQKAKDARRQALIDSDLNIDAALAHIAGQLGPEQRLRMEQFRAKRRARFLNWVAKHLQ